MVPVFFLLFNSSIIPVKYIFAASSENNRNPFITVLAYHHIIPDELPKGATTKAVIPIFEFEVQMKYLYENGYYTASLKDVEDFLYNGKTLPERTVLITFDDGYESNFVYAFPILKKYNFKAVVFLIGNTIVKEDEPFNPNILNRLSFRQIKEMKSSGLVEFGSHTFNAHEYRDRKPALFSMNQNQIEEDFTREAQVFTQNGLPAPKAIAYPYGRYNGTVLKAAKKFGYKLGFTLQNGLVKQKSNPLALNRVVIPPGTDIAKFKTFLGGSSFEMPADFKNSIILRIGSSTAYVKGRPFVLDSYPFIESGRTMVPLRFIAEGLGAGVDWISSERKIIVWTSAKTIELRAKPVPLSQDKRIPAGEDGLFPWDETIINGNRVFLDTPPILRLNRVMVPLRFLSEALGFEVKWNQVQNMVEIIDHS